MPCHPNASSPNAATTWRGIWRDGLWQNNVVLGQMLGLCPLLAVTTSAGNGLGMGLATMAVMVIANVTVSALRRWIAPDIRIPVYVLLIASAVTLVDMVLNAWVHELYKGLGLFIPLIVTNCAILGRAESFASKQAVWPSVLDALSMGLGFTWVLVLLGGLRELLGQGTLFAGAHVLFGSGMVWLETTVIPDYPSVLLLLLPPGGFLVLGFMMAARKWLVKRSQTRQRARTAAALIVESGQ